MYSRTNSSKEGLKSGVIPMNASEINQLRLGFRLNHWKFKSVEIMQSVVGTRVPSLRMVFYHVGKAGGELVSASVCWASKFPRHAYY